MTGPAPFFSVSSWVSRWADLAPRDTAIVFKGEGLTWHELDNRVDRLANVLREAGVKKGDRVAVYLKNRPEFIESVFAICRLGAVTVLINHFLTDREVNWLIQDSEPSAILTEETFSPVLDGVSADSIEHWFFLGPSDRPQAVDLAAACREQPSEPIAVPVTLDDPALLIYTSGTTGFPKGAVITHGNIHACADSWLVHVGLQPGDRHLLQAPLGFSGGTVGGVMPVVRSGGTIFLEQGFDAAAAIEIIQRESINFAQGVPTMWQTVARHPTFADADMSTLKALFVGGGPVPTTLLQTYQSLGIRMFEGFGMTEVPLAMIATSGRLGSCGRATINCEVKIVDDQGAECKPGEVGEMLFRGPVVFAGYWRNPEATARLIVDGWFHTGDLARRDEDGYYFIVDRKNDTIISGGLNVYPAEVENVLAKLDGVLESAVVGLSDDQWGETVVAAVVVEPARPLTPQQVLDFCKGQLAGYKLPKQVVVLDQELPRTSTGKISRRLVRDQLTKGT